MCGDLDETTFAVSSFTGEDCVSSPYSFSIYLHSSDANVAALDVVNKQATLFILRDGEYFPYSGIIAEFKYLGTSTDKSEYHVHLVPRINLLKYNLQTRVFQKMTYPEIIEKVFEDVGLSDYYTLDVQGTYPQREYIVQYQESDLNFISRLMEDVGIWYFFRELPLLQEDIDGVNREELIMTDKVASFEHISGESALVYRYGDGMHDHTDDIKAESVSKISFEERIVPVNVTMKNYNYRTPEVNITSQKSIVDGVIGDVYRYGEEFVDSDGAQNAASIESDRHTTEKIKVTGMSDCSGFKAGFRFELSEHERAECNDTYLIKSVSHEGSHGTASSGSGGPSYNNNFLAIPSVVIEHYRPIRLAKQPKINGIITATIEASGSDYASIDDMARYKVRMPFDLSGNDNYDASKYVRLAQPYSGSNYGIHFPSHEGTEMVMACIDGNPNRPVGIGTVPNANTLSPVVSNNKAQSIIRTAGDNEIVMDDTADEQHVKIKTAALNTAVFDDKEKHLFLQTTDENKLILDDANEMAAWNAKDQNITMTYKGGKEGIVITTGGGHVVKISDADKILTIQTNAGNVIAMDDNKDTITLTDSKSKNVVTLDGSKGLILDSKGEISIKAVKDLNIEAANINLTASTGKVEVKATTDLNLSGLKINEKATTDFNMEGLNVNSKAQLQSKIEGGLGVEIKSNLQTKISGTMTELSGQAMTTVKGAIVMIN